MVDCPLAWPLATFRRAKDSAAAAPRKNMSTAAGPAGATAAVGGDASPSIRVGGANLRDQRGWVVWGGWYGGVVMGAV